MTMTISLDKTNSVSNEDWLNVSKDLIINAYEPPSLLPELQDHVFTKEGFEKALKKVSRKVKK